MNFFHKDHDAVTPDGYLCSPLKPVLPGVYEGELEIQNIPDYFLGFHLPSHCLQLNLKSSLAQLGIDATLVECELSREHLRARLRVHFTSHDPIATVALSELKIGNFLVKLFAADDRRLVRSPKYLERMLKHTDHAGVPLLCFGKKLEHLIAFDVIDDRLIVSIPTLPGIIRYDHNIYGLLPLLGKALGKKDIRVRHLLSLYQHTVDSEKIPSQDRILLIKTEPLHIRTIFARVVNSMLPQGLRHTAANILEPTTLDSGDIYEFHGESQQPVDKIPLEFFTLEPYKERSFFCYRDLLRSSLESEETIQAIFDTAPQAPVKAATFLSKGSEISELSTDSWLTGSQVSVYSQECGLSKNLPDYMEAQPSFPFLQAMEHGLITSEGVLFSRYFPSSCLKGMLLSYHVNHYLKQIYFQVPSYTHGQFFSQHDRSLLTDLHFSGITTFWVDAHSKKVLQYVQRRGKDSGMFVPIKRVEEFLSAYFVGIHGSGLISKGYSEDLRTLLLGLHHLTQLAVIPGFSKHTPLAIMTGGGPGAMAVGNQLAAELNLLSCANLIDFEISPIKLNQQHNTHVQAKMTYRLPSLIERQEHFHVDLAIFVVGGIGTDFEFCLELVSIKTGKKPPVPVLLIGPKEYWKAKVSPIYRSNLDAGTIRGSEWVSNCIFCITSPEAGIDVFRRYMEQTLPIGPDYPPAPDGFFTV